ncbi:MAG: ATP-binding protein [Desulfonauticus sp.]|nr:ATP-binding protein [Desulfonauticus sp.]
MLIREFRGENFINREKEIEFLLNYFKKNPNRVLWIYGPKSTGKTTFIEYIVENHLLKNKDHNVKYINFRGKMIANYDNFVDAFIKPKDSPFFKNLSVSVNFHFLKVDSKLYEGIKKREFDFFEAVQEELFNSKKKNILIIDEIQTLQDIYMNGNKMILNEFLNFCVRLTKETHLSHVLISTSNTIFLNEIYNNAKMKVTSDFKLIDHLGYEDIKAWLINKNLGFREEDIDLIYDYLGGSVAHIKKLLDFRREYNSLQEQLDEMAEIAKNEIIFEKNNNLSNKEYDLFLQLAKIIIENGKFIFNEDDEKRRKELNKIINKFCNVEILFFDPIKNIVTANSRIYVKAFERIL